MEAMSLGVPVIARNNEGNAAIIEHCSTGMLYNSCEEFASCVEQLLSDAELRKSISTAAAHYAREHFAVDKEKEAWDELLKRV